jgi:hypothetical protein
VIFKQKLILFGKLLGRFLGHRQQLRQVVDLFGESPNRIERGLQTVLSGYRSLKGGVFLTTQVLVFLFTLRKMQRTLPR